MENWFYKLQKNYYIHIISTLLYFIFIIIIYCFTRHLNNDVFRDDIFIALIIGVLLFYSGTYILNIYQPVVGGLQQLTGLLYIQCNPSLLISYIEPVIKLAEKDKVHLYAKTTLKLRLKYLMALSYLYLGEAEKSLPYCNDLRVYIDYEHNLSNRLSYYSCIISTYLYLQDFVNARKYVALYEKELTSKRKVPFKQFEKSLLTIYKYITETADTDIDQLILLYDKLLTALKDIPFIHIKMQVYWQLSQLYAKKNDKEHQLSLLQEIVKYGNGLDIKQRAQIVLQEHQVDIPDSEQKNPHYTLKPSLHTAYALLALSFLPPLIILIKVLVCI